jgi:hypothetical protein
MKARRAQARSERVPASFAARRLLWRGLQMGAAAERANALGNEYVCAL